MTTPKVIDPQRFSSRHWLLFSEKGDIIGCACGFTADQDSDGGWGDSVVDHIAAAAVAEYRKNGRPMRYRVVTKSGTMAEFRWRRLANRFLRMMQLRSGYTAFNDARIEEIG